MALLLNTHPADWDSLLEQMIEATREAIDDALLHKKRHHVTDGQLEASGGGSRYRFRLQDDWEPGTATSVQVELDSAHPDQCIEGTILSTHNVWITLATEVPLPDVLLKKATLVESQVWLLRRLQETLLRLQAQGEEPDRMGARTFGLLPHATGRGTRSLQIATFTPDEEQAQAIEVGMESEQLFLIGPPGTGKTSVECTLALEHLQVKKTVLLVAHTNGALDTAMRRLKHYAEQSGNGALIEAHAIVRCGKATTLVGEAYQQMALQGIVDQQLGKQAKERERLQQTLSNEQEHLTTFFQTLEAQKASWEKERSRLQACSEEIRQQCMVLEQREQERVNRLATRLTTVEQERKSEQEQQQAAIRQASVLSQLLSDALLQRTLAEESVLVAKHQLVTFHNRSLVGQFFAHLNGTSEQTLLAAEQQSLAALTQAKLAVTALEQRQAVTSQSLVTLANEIGLLQEEERSLRQEQQCVSADALQIETFKGQIEQVERAIEHGDDQIAEAEVEGQRRQRVYDRLQMRLNEIADEQQTITEQVMAGARLIGTTLTGLTTNPALRDRLVDAVLVDEASMASLVMVLVAATHARHHVALFGDPLQLKPVAQLTEKQARLAAYWLGTDIFSYLHITLEDAGRKDKPIVMLTQQSRMCPAIAAPDSQFVYRGRLRNRVHPHRTPLRLIPHPEWPLMVIDTGDVDRAGAATDQRICHAQRPPRSSSKVNLYHVRCVVQLVRLLVAQLPQQETALIGIVTPYGAQKARIRRALQEHNLLQFVHVGTIHGVQSAEYPCVIFDTTEGYGVPIGQFTSNTWGRDGIPHDATRLLNVAHSRAQEKLIYLANVAYIYKDAYRQEHLLTKFVHAVEEQGRMDSSLLFAEKTANLQSVSDSSS